MILVFMIVLVIDWIGIINVIPFIPFDDAFFPLNIMIKALMILCFVLIAIEAILMIFIRILNFIRLSIVHS